MNKDNITIKNTVEAVVNSYISNVSVRKDVMQETWKCVIEGYCKNYVEKGRILSWVCIIAKNTCLDYFRHQKKDKEMLQKYRQDTNSTESDELNTHLLCGEVLDEDLKDLYKNHIQILKDEVLKDYYIHKMNKSMIARSLHMSRKTINRIINEHNKALLKKYDEYAEQYNILEILRKKHSF